MALNHNTYSGMTLKALLENPDLQHAPASLSGDGGFKSKKGTNGSGEIDFTSAFLGPQLWDKTYDANDFNLEYMDLDEFLSENGIPVVETPGLDQLITSPVPSPPIPVPQECAPIQASPSPNPLPSPSPIVIQPAPAVIPTVPLAVTASVVTNPNNFLLKPKVEKAEEAALKQGVRATSPEVALTGSTPPVSPLPVKVDFKLSEQDIVLSSVPGQGLFNPAAHTFTEEELKPQPMIKKSRKVFVPDELKDDKYWARRRKNNYAAKRSRDAKRVKENQIAMRAAYLEKENTTLKEELEKISRENKRLKHRLSKYESTSSST
ncbi:thyrotroph embryonic factor-like [Babylonia areolata]|uniref:thyrotroph embryonic factor-like n=1 Tax=Babylonia areolata TaxID=304850 RepID=UPI003FD109F4